MVVRMPGVAETLKSVDDMVTYGTDYKLVILSNAGNLDLTHLDQNSSFDEPDK